MDLFIILTLEEEIVVFETEFQRCGNVMFECKVSVLYLCDILQLMFDYRDGRVY